MRYLTKFDYKERTVIISPVGSRIKEYHEREFGFPAKAKVSNVGGARPQKSVETRTALQTAKSREARKVAKGLNRNLNRKAGGSEPSGARR